MEEQHLLYYLLVWEYYSIYPEQEQKYKKKSGKNPHFCICLHSTRTSENPEADHSQKVQTK